MKSFKYIKSLSLVFLSALFLTTSNICFDSVTAQSNVIEKPAISTPVSDCISALEIVDNPGRYLNKNVKMNAKFDKFAILGLDYSPAFRSSEEYISFLIKRDDTLHDIPLSEMKLFLKREQAEKHIDLKTNDEIQIVGKVFSSVLGDPWIDVESITLIKKATEENGVK